MDGQAHGSDVRIVDCIQRVNEFVEGTTLPRLRKNRIEGSSTGTAWKFWGSADRGDAAEWAQGPVRESGVGCPEERNGYGLWESGPKPIQLGESELAVEVLDVVSDVEDETAVVPPVQRSP